MSGRSKNRYVFASKRRLAPETIVCHNLCVNKALRRNPDFQRDWFLDPTGHSWLSSLWSFLAGFAGACVSALLTPVIGPVFAGMAGGAVSGAILGAIDGGLEGALKGAAWGAGIGGVLGGGYALFDSVGYGNTFLISAAVGGGIYAGVSGGLEGLGNYATGAVGAFYGGSLGNSLAPQKNSSVESLAAKIEQVSDSQVDNVRRLSENMVGLQDKYAEEYSSLQGRLVSDEVIANFGANPSTDALRAYIPRLPTRAELRAHYNKYVGPFGEMAMGIDTLISFAVGEANIVLGFLWDGIEFIDAYLRVDTGRGALSHFDSYIRNPQNKSMRLRELEAGTDWNPYR